MEDDRMDGGGAPDETESQDAQEESRSDTAPFQTGPRRSQQFEGGLDWRVKAVIGVIVLLVIVIYANRRWYQKDKQTPPGGQASRVERPPKEMSLEERYAALLRTRNVEAANHIFNSGDRVFVLARPPQRARHPKDPNRITIQSGLLVDVTDRLDEFNLSSLHRRVLFAKQPTPLFMGLFPSLGWSDKLKSLAKPAAEVIPSEIDDRERVIGVQIGEEARAYPVKYANFHEVINDTVGETPIVVAWSALAEAPTVMGRRLPDGTDLVFRAAGLLYKGGVVLFETEDEALWSSLERQCLTGKRHGTRLEAIPAHLTTWGRWKRLHPQTTALTGTEPKLNYPYNQNPAIPNRAYLGDQAILYPVRGFDVTKTPMMPKVRVFGVTGPDGKATKTYAMGLLAKEASELAGGPGPGEGNVSPVLPDAPAVLKKEDTIGGAEVLLEYDLQTNVLSAKSADGQALLCESMFWLYWSGLHPETEVWQEAQLRADRPPSFTSSPDTAAPGEEGEGASPEEGAGDGSASKLDPDPDDKPVWTEPEGSAPK